jgi:hypothetical protein
MSVLGISPVVRTSNRDGAVKQLSSIFGAVVQEFQIPNTELTVTVLPGLSILSGTEADLQPATSLVATVFVESLETTENQLIETGWTLVGSLGSPGSVLARDSEGGVFEFVERA